MSFDGSGIFATDHKEYTSLKIAANVSDTQKKTLHREFRVKVSVFFVSNRPPSLSKFGHLAFNNRGIEDIPVVSRFSDYFS